MPVVVNGTVMIKPLWNGAPLNCLHVWFQNHWTGTADASPSTLSDDNGTIATNLADSPTPLAAGWQGTNCTLSDTSTGMELTCSTAGADAYAGCTVTGTQANTAYVVAATLVSAASTSQVYNGWIFAYDSDSAGMHTHSTGDWTSTTPGMRTLTFTTADSTSFNVRLYGAHVNVGDTAVWIHFGVYTLKDWQAMQALGITHFDGNTYTR